MNKMGFGFLRLPKLDPQDDTSIDYELLNRMVDAFLEAGGTYFDTAYTYLSGESESALRKSLVERHLRSSYRVATKLPSWKVKCEEDNERYFKEQQERCGLDYFDVYLLHWLNAKNYEIAEKYYEFAFMSRLKAEGKVGAIGFSYHDSAELLDEILTKHPEVDYVQLQLNYLDWDSPSVQAQLCYETAVKHGKKVLVMEPVKGGTLAEIPAEAAAAFAELDPTLSPAQWALRFAQSLPEVEIVLSGMNSMEQMAENMQDVPLMNEQELAACGKAREIIRSQTVIPCTACGYCAGNCPKKIAIPQYFKLYNEYARNHNDDWKIQPVYDALCKTYGKASDCIGCLQCERNCPQKIQITHWLKETAKALE